MASIAQLLRALRPSYTSAEEKLVYAVHAFFLSEDYRLVGVGDGAASLFGGASWVETRLEEASSRDLPDVSESGWDLSDGGGFALLYRKVSAEAGGERDATRGGADAGGGAESLGAEARATRAPSPLLLAISFEEISEGVGRESGATASERSVLVSWAWGGDEAAVSLRALPRRCALGPLSAFARDASPSPPSDLARLAKTLRENVLEAKCDCPAAATRPAPQAVDAPEPAPAREDPSAPREGGTSQRALPEPPAGDPLPQGSFARPPPGEFPAVGIDDREPAIDPMLCSAGARRGLLPPDSGPPPSGMGGSQVGPDHPLFTARVGRGGGGAGSRLGSSCPPGARWDPPMPPGFRGSMPGDYLRPGGIHPDMAQPGAGGDPTGGLGPDGLGFAGHGLFPGGGRGAGRGGGGGFGGFGGFGGGGSFSSF